MGMGIFLITMIVPLVLLMVTGGSQTKYLNERSEQNLKDRTGK